MKKQHLPPVNLRSALDFFIELILILILVISPFLFGSVDIFAVTIIEIGAFLLLFLWLLKLMEKGSLEFVKLPINIPIALFLIFAIAQYFFINSFISDFSLGDVYRQKMKNELLKVATYLILFYIILHNFQDRKKINRLIGVLILVGFAISTFGIIQKLTGAKKMFWIYDAHQTPYFFASFRNRNHFANYINLIIFLTMGFVFGRLPFLRHDIKGSDKKSIIKGLSATFQKWIWLYVCGVIVMSSSLFFSVSRGGIISFLCGVVLFLVLIFVKRLTRRGYLILFLAFVLIFAMLVWINATEQIVQRFEWKGNLKISSIIDKNLGGRRALFDSTLNLIKHYPIFGVGIGAFEFIYNKKYIPASFKVYFYVDHAHNDFLELLSEVGVIGFAIFFMAACIYIFFALKTLLKRHDPFVIGT
ncbi:MAG: O-antigen ligase family protein, partial [Candidatus Omnitrophica bacterium]|nr:O-antigen ligase family protein [Candidatus Omnitrophota bacterium]